MYVTLFDDVLPAPVPKRARRRRALKDGHQIFSRWPGKGHNEQLRWWLPGHGSINLGLYDPGLLVTVRRQVAAESGKHPATPLGLWAALRVVLAVMRDRGIEVPDVMPRYVERVEGGFIGRVRKGGILFETATFDTPETAHRVIEAQLAAAFPRKVKPEYVSLVDFILAAPVGPPGGERPD
jgi:hypothetical protein